jgi:hypothetical protein
MKKSNYLTEVEDFKLARQIYQTMLRDKKKAYFLNTTPNDFKTSIEFWDLHFQHMKLRSDSSSNISITADCKSFTFNNFRSNLSDKIGKIFSFKHTDQATVYDCLMNVNNKSSVGCSGKMFWFVLVK